MPSYRVSYSEATEMVDAIVRDLTDRRGLSAAWAEIDDETIEEIKREWRRIIALRPTGDTGNG